MAAVHFRDQVMQSLAPQIRQLTARAGTDGLQVTEMLTFFFQATNIAAGIGCETLDVPMGQQKDEVVDLLRGIYQSLNPNLPWITEPFETLVETAMFQYLVPVLYTTLFRSKVSEREQREAALQVEEPELLKQLRAVYETPEGAEVLSTFQTTDAEAPEEAPAEEAPAVDDEADAHVGQSGT